jgi:hypothetical protein
MRNDQMMLRLDCDLHIVSPDQQISLTDPDSRSMAAVSSCAR